MDTEFMAKFTTAPAGMKNHHAYQGGLLEHVLSVCGMAKAAAAHYANIDRATSSRH